MAWSKAVEAIANSVSAIANTVTAYGPNEEGKAVKAAKKAGNQAKKNVDRVYPKCETNIEWKNKTSKFDLPPEVTNRQQYNQARAKLILDAYNDAYGQVMQLYHDRLVSESGGVLEQLGEEDNESKNTTNNMGCIWFASLLAIPSIGGVCYFLIS